MFILHSAVYLLFTVIVRVNLIQIALVEMIETQNILCKTLSETEAKLKKLQLILE